MWTVVRTCKQTEQDAFISIVGFFFYKTESLSRSPLIGWGQQEISRFFGWSFVGRSQVSTLPSITVQYSALTVIAVIITIIFQSIIETTAT